MATFAIMRATKLAKMGNVGAALQHCYRGRETPNADAERTPTNEHWEAASKDEAMGRMRELLPDKRRKDAVLAVEYVMTASPEWWSQATPVQQQTFFERSHAWLAEKYGSDRIIAATIHRDEKSPHMSAFVVPLTLDGRLSAKEFIGNRTKMSADQTSFAEKVVDLGLVRGIEGSRATHQRVKSHYAALDRPQKPLELSAADVQPRVLKRGMFTREEESPTAVAERLTQQVREANQPTEARAAQWDTSHRRAVEAVEIARRNRDRAQKMQQAFQGVTREQMRELITTAGQMRQANRDARRSREQDRGRDRGR